MVTAKKTILKTIENSPIFSRKESFVFRVCRLMKNGEFDSVLASGQLAHLINEGPGRKIKASNLTSLMEPLLTEGVIKIRITGKGAHKKKYWFPAWIDKNQVESTEVLSNKAVFLSGAAAWTDSNREFPSIIKALEGDLCIVDPFYGHGTFFALSKFGKVRQVRFLSAQLGNDEQKNITNFQTDLKKFKSEFKNIVLRKYHRFYELHDRYIIADNALVVIGYGIKDLANKESFIIFLPKNAVGDFLPDLRKVFEQRWAKSNVIS